MHELGVVLEIFDLLEEIEKEQNLKKISSVTLEIGELSGILPDYLRECWNAARLSSEFEKTQLIIEYVPAVASCKCGAEYEMLKNNRICPACGQTDYKVVRGREFELKQIEAC